MDEKQVIDLQKRFVEFHRYFGIVFLAFNVNLIIEKTFGIIEIISLLAFFLLILLEFFIFSPSKMQIRSWKFQCFRYVQFLVSTFLLYRYDDIYEYAMAFLVCIIFSVELYFSFDYSDQFYNGLFIWMLTIPMVISAVVYNLSNRFYANSTLFKVIVVYIGFIVFSHMLTKAIATVLVENDNKVYAKERMLEKSKETNEELKISQEKIKLANDQLGVQKIKLESAYKQISNVNKEMMIQNDILKYVSSSLDIEKLMTIITDAILNEIGVDVCAIILYPKKENEKIRYRIRTRLGTSFIKSLSEAIEEHMLDSYLTSEGVYVDNHIDENKYRFLKRGLIGSVLMVPLVEDDGVKGGLFVAHPKYDYFVENKDFFEGIVAQFMIAMKNANLYQQMEDMAIRDGLTGIYNRRHLTLMLNSHVTEAMQNHFPLSVALFDIDHFKNVNDTYGHLFGDVVIKTIAGIANDYALANDGFAGRYGGEEFVLVFPKKTIDEAYEIVKRMHVSVQQQELHHNDMVVHVHVSVGLTSYPETCKDPGELFNHADWSMYYSKENGRNRITVDSEEILSQVKIK